MADELSTKRGGANAPPSNSHCHTWVDRQLISPPEHQICFWRSVIAIHRSVMVVCIGSTDTDYDPVNSNSRVKPTHIPYTRAARILNHAARRLKHCIDDYNSQKAAQIPTTIAFIFDEARTFLEAVNSREEGSSDRMQSFLHYMRLAMYFFPKEDIDGVKIAVALLDTFGSVAEYAPPDIPDPSLRFVAARRLCPPFVAFPHQSPHVLATDPPLSAVDIVATWRTTGRRLWRSYNKAESLLEIAEAKLRGGSRVPTNSDKNHLLHLAIIGARVEFHFHAQNRLLLQLVHGHGATLYSVSPDRTVVTVGYPSEPVLSAAATQLTLSACVKWVDLLEALIFETRTGLVAAGERGELVARVMLLMAFDFVRRRPPMSPHPLLAAFTVRSLLDALFYGNGPSELNLLIGDQWSETHTSSFLDHGIVNFTHFVYATHSPRHHEIWRYYHDFAAIFCRRGQDVYDLILPVYLKDSAQYSYILVQVKLHQRGSGLPSLPDDVEMSGGLLRDSGSGNTLQHPFLYVFLQLGQRCKPWKSRLYQGDGGRLQQVPSSSLVQQHSQSKPARHSDPPRGRAHRMAMIGACSLATKTFPFLSADECANLVQLSTAWVDPVENVRNPPWTDARNVTTSAQSEFAANVLKSVLRLSYPVDEVDSGSESES